MTAESNETCYRRTLNSAVVVAIFDRRIKWDLLQTNIQFGGRHRGLRPQNQAKPIYRRTFNSAVVVAIFEAESNETYYRRQFGGRHRDFRPTNQVRPITDEH
jgi:hypothetical protein